MSIENEDLPSDVPCAGDKVSPSLISGLVGAAYRSLPEVFPGFSPREQQQQMIKRVNGLIARGVTGVIQAPTGTGKSLGYLIPGIIGAALQDRVLIVSTATASLQDQLSKRDIPDALKAVYAAKMEGVSVAGVTIAVAKGRDRHVCPLKLDALASSSDLFREKDDEIEAYIAVQKSLTTGEWDGTRDSLAVPMPHAQWRKIANDAASCTGRNCSFYKECPYYNAQEAMKTARIVVTNHDYLLACISNLPQSPLSNPKAIYVFDEAHHLPDKIIGAFARTLSFSSFWEEEIEAVLPWLGEDRQLVDLAQERVKGLWNACERSIETMLGDARQHRFELGEPPPQFLSLMADLGKDVYALKEALTSARDSFRKREATSRKDGVATIAEMQFGRVLAEVTEAYLCIDDFVGENERARWLNRGRFGVELCCSPFDAAAIAKTHLWPVAKNSILTSATFAALGVFEPALRSLGLPLNTSSLKLSSPFDYKRASLRVPKMVVDGNDPAHGRRVRAYLGDLITDASHVGVLVYFTSKKMMGECFESLSDDVKKLILLQGALQTSSIIQEHRARIDSGARSVIFGLDNFGEGIDLPGQYCTRVVITKLPFPHQDDPVTATHGEHLKAKGVDAFHTLTLPKAGLKFAQVCGRLMRRETDQGDVLVLDKRLVSKRYGKMMVSGTPFAEVLHD